MFWVLGGYLVGDKLKAVNLKKYGNYLIRKIGRLYPIYAISLILGMFLCNIQNKLPKIARSAWAAEFWNQEILQYQFIEQLMFKGDYNLITPPQYGLCE